MNRSTRARHGGPGRAWPWPRALALALGLAATPAFAQPPDTSAWEACRDGLRADAARRARLTEIADSLAAERQGAIAAGDAAREQRLLARGEALADSLREAALASLAHELICAEMRRDLLSDIDARLPATGGAERETLLALRERVAAGAATPVRAEFELIPPGEGDPPEILRLKAGYARDLVDRAERWLERLARERQRLVQARLGAEAGGLVADQWFFDEHAALRVEGERSSAGGAGAPGFLGQLLRDTGGGAPNALDLVDAMARWLREKRSELAAAADSLELQAERRERER